jgi:hypothetical protein
MEVPLTFEPNLQQSRKNIFFDGQEVFFVVSALVVECLHGLCHVRQSALHKRARTG